MTEFLAAFALFLALHSIPAVPAIRSEIIRHVGRPVYFVGYSAVSAAALIWVFSSALALDYIPLWELRPANAAVAFVFAPFGIFLVIAGLLSANPLSITLNPSPTLGSVTKITRHPVLWGFAAWASGHIAANGDLRSLLLFGGFAAFALGAIPMTEKRSKRRLGGSWAKLAGHSSILPFAACLKGEQSTFDMPMLVAGLLTAVLTLWLLFAGGHSAMFGADPLALFI
ncbi:MULTISPECIES: NnrU family protein [Rhizobium]|uniref:NnrU family protein n=1 Tax=Rhizobium TaxID=379 RepID=UPI001B3304F1|nr:MULTISPECIES: NnrU family protein [Rhizobium]MBX4911900.1 NnrU family protein [Rhizobium bangladeshense]MBX5260843.1 NnrU family protein [Rhizobium sp. NLR16b]MBX5266932.1 NnrU family protein [Rhizobium sp. NLR16a]MBX5315500.1 NnrU family protein [Rhizobium sp. NLR11b]QTV00499.1 NnrU family protein [Rhizobium sp. NLR16a]